MNEICGITLKDATFEDFQRYIKCENYANSDCNEKGLRFPATCSTPPCDRCSIDNSGNKVNKVEQ